jgi:hypothetical protein
MQRHYNNFYQDQKQDMLDVNSSNQGTSNAETSSSFYTLARWPHPSTASRDRHREMGSLVYM